MTCRCASLVAVVVCLPSLLDAGSVVLEVSAGKYDRQDVPVVFELPTEFAGDGALELAEIDGDRETPVAVQRVPGATREICFVLSGQLAAGASRRYRLGTVDKATAGEAVGLVDDGKHLWFRVGGRLVLRYNYATIEPPAGYDPIFARSGYIHPVWNPSGGVITNDFPPNHRHHHGIWFPHTNTEFEGRKVDFWNSGEKLGKVEFVGMESRGGGAVFGWFRARHRHIDLTAPGGPKAALDEVWEVRVYPFADHFLFDLTSTQTCASESPLHLKEYRYGGLGFRGSREWEGQDVYYFTSERHTRRDGHTTTARWCEVYGQVEGRATGIAILCHPANFRAPQNMRIHPSEPFFNFAPCQAGDFAIEPGKPYVSRYRFYVHDGGLEPFTCDRLWSDYAEPPVIRVVGSP